jgi:hypothetical protein
VGRRVLLARLDVLPAPVVADEALERALEVTSDPGSAFSLIITPAVVCGTKTSAAAPAPASAASTSRVISISCVRRSLRRVISRT